MDSVACHSGIIHSCEHLRAAPLYRASGQVSAASNIARDVLQYAVCSVACLQCSLRPVFV